jgi:D-alanine-D-alanine ligase
VNILILHGEIPPDAGRDEQDTLVQVEAVGRGLAALGHRISTLPLGLDLAAAAGALTAEKPDLVFNLVESLAGKGSLIALAPALLAALGWPCTGADAAAMTLTSNKLLAKRWLAAAGLPTPPWFSPEQLRPGLPVAGPWIVKSVWEHASIGLYEDSVLPAATADTLRAQLAARRIALGGEALAEAYIDGRELNLSLLEGPEGPEVLPPAEIRFDAYPPGKVRVVGYRSKWEEDSFEFRHTPRCFDFPAADALLLAGLRDLARRCWHLFGLAGYARVDFRVDARGNPWILEVNANPCLSPDGGFQAAAERAGLSFADVLARIVAHPKGKPAASEGSAAPGARGKTAPRGITDR